MAHNCKKCGFNLDRDPSPIGNSTVINAHAEQLCCQCFAQSKMSKDANKKLFRSFFTQ